MFNYFYNYFYNKDNKDNKDCILKYKNLVNKEILLNNIILKPVNKINKEYDFIMNIKKYNPKYNPKNEKIIIDMTNIIEGYLKI